MHAFLLVGNDKPELKIRIESLASELKAKILEFPLVRIEDVRNLNSMVRLSLNEPTLIVSYDIQETGVEALNAFLKNLEEPQDNVYFAITAPSTRKVLPTIVSRCQIIKLLSTKYQVLSTEVQEFAKMTTGQKFLYIEKIKDRGIAINFVEGLIGYYHSEIHNYQNKNLETFANNSEAATQTLNNLKANGNVTLQLSNLIISLK